MEFDRNLFDEIVSRVTTVVRPDRIIVFGSTAEGGFGEDSDIDLLILTDESENTRRNRVRIRDALRGLGVPIDVVMMSSRRFDETKDIIGGIAHPANNYGKVLYEAA